MNPWANYEARVTVAGRTERGAALRREQGFLARRMQTSLSCHHATVDGIEREINVINSDNLNEKTIFSLPGETFKCGALVEWSNNRWLITELDANTEVYTRAKIEQCNYLLRWINPSSKEIIERWCIVEDGTKYLTGEFVDNLFVINRGDSRLGMTLPRDSETVLLGRDHRFLIDDYDSPQPLAYRLSKPFKLGHTFNDEGVLKFVLQEVATEDTDNFELHIANYYKYFPDDHGLDVDPPVNPAALEGKKVWL